MLGFMVALLFSIVVGMVVVEIVCYKERKRKKELDALLGPSVISLLDLLKKASKKGWVFSRLENGELLRFGIALRQAAECEEVRFWGRKELNNGAYEVSVRLTEIDKEYWRNNSINILSTTNHFSADEEDIETIFVEHNFSTYTHSHLQWSEETQIYTDIHISKTDAMKWLKHKARTYKGIDEY